MSLSKVSLVCELCGEKSSLYKCPKCYIKYCSSSCFKHPKHNKCSEVFYQEWVLSSLKNQRTSDAEKQKMIEILKKSAAEKDDDICDESEPPSIEERFADIDLSKDVGEKHIWERLTDEEKKSFKEMLANEKELSNILPVVQPWWVLDKVKYVKDHNSDPSDYVPIAERPPLPISIKPISLLTSKPPSDNVQYNIVNILFCYTCLIRLYNNEPRDFIEDVVDSIFVLSPVLSENKNYSSLDEVVHDSLRLITNLHLKLDMIFAKSLTYDVCCILNGPQNARSYTYIICSLNDIKSLLLEFKMSFKKEDMFKNVKQTLAQSVRKLDYLISWSVDYSKLYVNDIAKEIEEKYYPEVVSDILNEPVTEVAEATNQRPKVLIEEIN